MYKVNLFIICSLAEDSCLEVVYRMYWLCYHIHTYMKTQVIYLRKKYRKIPCNFIGFSLRDMWFISICGTGQFCVKLVSHDINFTLTQVLDANSTIP